MKRLLLLLGAAALLVAAPATAQYVYLDVNHDGVCTPDDVLGSGTTSVDLYFDTNHNADGSTVTCSDGSSPLDIFSYGFILTATGIGSVAYGTYTDNMSTAVPGGFSAKLFDVRGGSDIFIAYGGTVAGNPGLYRIGTLAITVTGDPVLSYATSSSIDPSNAITAFGTHCPGDSFDGSQILGRDFTGNCGTSPKTATIPTTWGAIKNLYK